MPELVRDQRGQVPDYVIDGPRNPERSAAPRKLLEAKDAAVRAAIFQEDN